MRLFSKIFGSKKKEKEDNKQEALNELVNKNNSSYETVKNDSKNKELSLDILSEEFAENETHRIHFSSSPVGTLTDSVATDFYVYEWFIKDTEEIFYVGKGRGNRYKAFHERAYEAEKIRKTYETSSRFLGTGLTEEQAIELESKEMTRILNETNDRLTNRIIPFFTKRDNGYDRSPKTPELQFETAPCFYASEIEEHYFGINSRAFDEIEADNLKVVVFITRNIRDEINVIYGGKVDKYQNITRELLAINGSKILKSKFAKSVTAWIYIGNDYVTNYEQDQEQAIEKLGRTIPTYHLIDVWRLLKERHRETELIPKQETRITPIHNRISITDIKNLNNWEKGFDEGMPYWEEGDKERKAGNIERAIELFDSARYNGYNAPALYRSYAMAYRKLKDYDNEVAIINEGIERGNNDNNTTIRELKERRVKALILKQKQDDSLR